MTATELVKYREDLGMTGKEFATHLHVSPATVSQWEHGKTKVPRLVEKLLRVLQELERLKAPVLPGMMAMEEVLREERVIESGKCQCGCGGDLQPAKKTRASRRIKKGGWPFFLSGHNARRRQPKVNGHADL